MKQDETANEILAHTPLNAIDAARIVMECVEIMGESVAEMSPRDVMMRMRRIMRAGHETLQAREATVSLEVAAWQSVESRTDRRPTTRRDLRHFVRRMLRVPGAKEKPLRSMNTRDCRYILQSAFGASPSSYAKGRAILHSIFAYGIRQEWCDSNPVDRIASPKIREKNIGPLSMAAVEKLKRVTMQPKFRDMRFSVALMLYAGLRPTEVLRLKPGDINWEERQVIVRSHCSKTGGGRAVSLRALKGIAPQDMSIPRNWQRRWQALRRAAGFKEWIPDICRHTFASYHATYFRNLSDLQVEMGHRDITLLRCRYVAPTLRHDAAQFWQTTAFPEP